MRFFFRLLTKASWFSARVSETRCTIMLKEQIRLNEKRYQTEWRSFMKLSGPC